MTNELLSIGIPTLAVLVGILVNNSRLGDLRAHMDSIIRSEVGRLESEIHRVEQVNEARMTMILGKIEDIDTRLARLEERFSRS